RLMDSRSHRCIFVSQDPAKDIRTLADKAKIVTSPEEFQQSLGEGQRRQFDRLILVWNTDLRTAASWLTRCEFRTESQSGIDSTISVISELYFLNSDAAFELLREFLESRINQVITTESSRRDICADKKLA